MNLTRLPTDSQIAASKLAVLRDERNAKLAETDWLITMHKEKGTNIPTAWKTYRQALRDITDSATSLDDVEKGETRMTLIKTKSRGILDNVLVHLH